ncbi:MAG: Bacterial leucyl aminopeptidase precursor [Nitrososphaeraceae archaeon]|jgi:Zn-dependent M28 family amino/carboxypeptidase|nr:Bacterial leucyl aminopeptidase precursor [Nitrososphaeraceae archaeon]
MSDDKIEHYDPPDKRKRPSIPLFPSKRTEFERTAPVVDKFINSVVSLVSTENIQRWINLLTSYHNRHSRLQVIDEVAVILQEEFRNLGYSDVYFHNYIHSDEGKDYRLKNVICNKAGKTSKVILICAHYDTIVYDKKGTDIIDARAPGADDNASGVASILEIARLLSKIYLNHTIQLVFFSGEEQGFWGSTHYAQHIKDNDIELYRLINLDMIGFRQSLRRLK